MKIRIEKIVYPGRSLAREQGKVYFTDEGLPHELVEVEILQSRAHYTECTTTSLIEPSSFRIHPRCTHYKICSPYQYIDYPTQLEIKHVQIQEMFHHALGNRVSKFEVQPAHCLWGYRNKIHLHIVWHKGRCAFAYHQPTSVSTFVPIEECFLASNLVNVFLMDFLSLVQQHGLNNIKEIVVRQSYYENNLFVIVYLNENCMQKMLVHLAQLLAHTHPLCGMYAIFGDKSFFMPLYGASFYKEKIAEKEYSIGPLCFFQVNTEMASMLIQDLQTQLTFKGTEVLADIYCGVGTFGLALANRVGRVLCVESSSDNVTFLHHNIKGQKASCVSSYQMSAEQWIQRCHDKIDVLIIDPPRKGIAQEIRNYIVDSHIPKIVYISCNPTTLARDLTQLSPYYSVEWIKGYDFFPHTPHIEVCTILSRT